MWDVGGVAVVGMTVKAERRWKTPEWKQTSYSSSLPPALPSTHQARQATQTVRGSANNDGYFGFRNIPSRKIWESGIMESWNCDMIDSHEKSHYEH